MVYLPSFYLIFMINAGQSWSIDHTEFEYLNVYTFIFIPSICLKESQPPYTHLDINVETCRCVVGCVRNKVLIRHLQHPKPKDVQPSSADTHKNRSYGALEKNGQNPSMGTVTGVISTL